MTTASFLPRTTGRAFGRADLPFVRSPAQRHALDVSHRSDGGLDVWGRHGGVELDHEPTIEVIRLEGGGRRLHPAHRAQRLQLANDEHRPAPFEGSLRSDHDGDEEPGS